MRKRFEVQLRLDQTPIEKVQIPTKSRDELPPILAGLQWIFQTPEVNQGIFELLEKKLVSGKKATGRPGLDLWQILVLGVVRLGLDCDYDRLEHLANFDGLIRQILGVPAVRESEEKPFHHKTLSENVCHVDEELLSQINAIVAQAGRAVFKKNAAAKEQPIRAKADTYVVETNVHFPTDLNLMWDAQRKCLDLLVPLCERCGLEGWRKAKDWRGKLKGQMRVVSKVSQSGGAHKAQRLQEATRQYLDLTERFEGKVWASLKALETQPLDLFEVAQLLELDYYHSMLVKHYDLVDRRLIQGQKIPHAEKVFSLFEPHTQWINKGKCRPEVELGHKLLITTDQHQLILDYRVMDQLNDADEVVPLADRLLARYGQQSIASLSFDKGFSRKADRELLELYIPEVILPKKGKLNGKEREQESQRKFKVLRNKHQAIESEINCLEHHGLNRCPDKGLAGYQRYIGFGVLAYNLHKIGARLLKEGCEQEVRTLLEKRPSKAA